MNNGTIEGLKILNLSTFSDIRGKYIEIYNEDKYGEHLNSNTKFVTDCLSYSNKNVLRGLHGEHRTSKLIQCIFGEIQHVILDIRKNSSTLGKYQIFELSGDSKIQILVPKGCVQGFLCKSDLCIFYYKQTTYYKGIENQLTIKWNDPFLKIPWAIENPILSERDENGLGYLEYLNSTLK